MAIFLSIIRGINVGGKNTIKMADLRNLYEELGLKNVITYIQSGNVIFQSKPDKQLVSKIEEKLFDLYKLKASVIIRSTQQIRKVIKNNPFINETKMNPANSYVIFLNKKPDNRRIAEFKNHDYGPEKYFIAGNEIYLYCHNGYGRTKLNNNYFENKLNVTATARNWNTIIELYRLLSESKLLV
jgi:uncharacterized protein (DUF1697 family)